MKKVLLMGNGEIVIYNFRLELIEKLLSQGVEVHISCPYGERIKDLIEIGCIFHDIDMARHGMNPFQELKLIKTYEKLIDEVKPDCVFSYTIKPNIYGAIACRKKGVRIVCNITGLGTAVERGGISQLITLILYKYAFTDIQRLFFQNTANQEFFIKHKIALSKHALLPGSGVNLERFPLLPYPEGDIIRFVFIARIMEEKGINYYLNTAKYIKEKYPNTEFHVCGFKEAEYNGKLDEYNKDGIVIYHGMVRDISKIHVNMHCTVFPSYYGEGLSNVLLEAASSGRTIITTDRPGCREAIDDGISGFMIPVKNQEALNEAVEKFVLMTKEERIKMGEAGRRKAEREFNRDIVVNRYLEELYNE